MKLDGKTILVTGGSSGIGYELARRLADRNQVVIIGRTTESSIARAKRRLLC
jgi:uncharacterized oxidoreductase